MCNNKTTSNRSKISHTEVIQRYVKGESSVKISKLSGISPTAIIGILRRNKVQIRKGTKKYNYDAIASDYKKGIFLIDVAKKYKTNPSNIVRIIKAKNVKLRGKRKGENHPNWKGGKTHDVDGYVVEKKGRTHRIKMEEATERKLFHWEHIHHIDGDRKNYNFDNLVIIPNREHERFHTFLRQAKLKINEENLEKFCRRGSKFVWRFIREDFIKAREKVGLKLSSINERKRIEKRCRVKNCNKIGYTTVGYCSKHYQRMMAKKRGYWRSGKNRKSIFRGKNYN